MRAALTLALWLLSGLAFSDDMAAAREALWQSHGAGTYWKVMGDRLEVHPAGHDTAAWEGYGWIGGDTHKFWLDAEAEYELGENRFEEAELQGLYSVAIAPFWDLQAGVRLDLEPGPRRTYAALGLHGTAPYWFEVDGHLYVSDRGDLSVQIESEYELRLTQRLILQPRAEVVVAFSDDDAAGVGPGLSSLEAGLRLRYELSPQFAPYVGVSWSRAYGRTADLSEDPRSTSIVAGVRFWF